MAQSRTTGYRTGTIGDNSSVEGGALANPNEASGTGSHAEGYSTVASGAYSHAEGNNTTASGNYSHAEGNQTTASGNFSHAEGDNTTASGTSCHAEGLSTVASGSWAHAEGSSTLASNTRCHAGGYGAISNKPGEWSRSCLGSGEAQYGIMAMTIQTTNATPQQLPTLLASYGSSGNNDFVIEVDSSYRLDITLLAVDTSNGDSKEWAGFGIIKNVGGTTSLVAAITLTSTVEDAGLAAATVAVTADNTNDTLDITVTGIALTGIRWFAKIEYIKITF